MLFLVCTQKRFQAYLKRKCFCVIGQQRNSSIEFYNEIANKFITKKLSHVKIEYISSILYALQHNYDQTSINILHENLLPLRHTGCRCHEAVHFLRDQFHAFLEVVDL